jgi:hypothetical protein
LSQEGEGEKSIGSYLGRTSVHFRRSTLPLDHNTGKLLLPERLCQRRTRGSPLGFGRRATLKPGSALGAPRLSARRGSWHSGRVVRESEDGTFPRSASERAARCPPPLPLLLLSKTAAATTSAKTAALTRARANAHTCTRARRYSRDRANGRAARAQKARRGAADTAI